MKLTLVVTKKCNGCKKVEAQLKQFIIKKVNVNLLIIDINDFNKPWISIVPVLLIEDELFSYGDVDENKLLIKLIKV